MSNVTGELTAATNELPVAPVQEATSMTNVAPVPSSARSTPPALVCQKPAPVSAPAASTFR